MVIALSQSAVQCKYVFGGGGGGKTFFAPRRS